jgi:hypothetical protein
MSDSCDAAFREALDGLYRRWGLLDAQEGFDESFDQWLAPIVRQMVEAGAKQMRCNLAANALPQFWMQHVHEAALRVARGDDAE